MYMKMGVKISSICLVIMPFLASVVVFLYFRSSIQDFSEAKIWDRRVGTNDNKEDHGNFHQPQTLRGKAQNDLFDSGTDKKSCLSKFESSFYRKNPPHKPSPYLLSKLRAYETLHRRCSPNTQPYNETLKKLELGSNVGNVSDCNYIVYITSSGLGNRILTITASFLYAVLTNRVLLVDFGSDMSDLFCEPFPKTSWLLPENFHMRNQFQAMDISFPQSFGNMLRDQNMLYTMTATNISDQSSLPSYLYLYLNHDYTALDKLFFCDDYQRQLPKVPWLFLKSNNYFVPSFFLMPSFEQELAKLFPEKGTVFHHLGRYLFNPSNDVWGLVKRYYHTYLAEADEIIGIQIRTFGFGHYEHFMDQIMACSMGEKLLPKIVDDDANTKNVSQQRTAPKRKAVLITSLSPTYFENLKDLYLRNPTVTGDMVGFYQPSHEELQQTERQTHNSKAWTEMYLLSLVDVLVTSAWSTFGYVAQGLGGLRPWVLLLPTEPNVPDPPCVRVGSMEPCFHAAPTHDCKAQKDVDTGAIDPHVRHCEDVREGLKVVDDNYE